MNNLRKIRKLRSLTQYELGKAIGKYASFISKVETGKLGPWTSEREALAKALGVQVSDIFPDNS